MLQKYRGPADLPEQIPIFPLADALLLPRSEMPLNIFEPRYLAMFDFALSNDRIIGIIMPRELYETEKSLENGDIPSVEKIGCAGRITSFIEQPDGRILVTLTGISRFQIIEEIKCDQPWRAAQVSYDPFAVDFDDHSNDNLVDRDALLTALKSWLETYGLHANWEEVERADNETLVNTLAMLSPFDGKSKQALLEAPDLKTRADVLVAITEWSLALDYSNFSLQ